ncbi:MAG: hypothetical protein IT289_12210 [Oligoflexia bacterium]|nr:hypothetical protein [Oligoflexia bacterium]
MELETTLANRVVAIEELFIWIRKDNPSTRLRYLLQVLDNNPQLKQVFAENLRCLLEETESLSLFAHAGLVREESFFSELVERLVRKILPSPPTEKSLWELFIRIFPDESDAKWVSELPTDVVRQIVALIEHGAHEDPFFRIRFAQTEALLILSSQVASLGLDEVIRSRLQYRTVSQNPFYRLTKSVAQTVEHLTSTDVTDEVSHQSFEASLKAVFECQSAIQSILGHLEQSGVSVNLVYSLDQMASGLYRIESLLRFFFNEDENRSLELAQDFVSNLIEQVDHSRGIWGLFDSNIHLLSRKIVERTAETGVHYITHSPQEYRRMLLSASGGGILTVFTTVLKSAISQLKLPLFFDGLFASLNYATSFVVLQFGHLTLATKQPAMTASTLAAQLKNLKTERDVESFVLESACLTRSQIAAIAGNVGFVVPGCVLFCWGLSKFNSGFVMTPEYARYILEGLHPFKSLTIPLAALTGVILWFSSIAAGWIDNWFVFNRLPEAISKHRTLNRIVGVKNSERLSRWLTQSMAGLGGSISLGFCLGFTPVFGKFFGLPLDVRHVTLSAGSATVAVYTLGWHESWNSAIWALAGIGFIGLLNLTVSFSLSLFVAARARRIHRGWLWVLFKATWSEFKKSPGKFLLPTGN